MAVGQPPATAASRPRRPAATDWKMRRGTAPALIAQNVQA